MEETKVLDHGYLRVVEVWGSDERCIESARMSTAKGFQGWGPVECPVCLGASVFSEGADTCPRCGGTGFVEGDEKLLRTLKENNHSTPFEMAGMTIEVQAPIFVFREWHRHRTFSYSEHSARYSPLPALDYVPDVRRVCTQALKNKQASGEPMPEDDARAWLDELESLYIKVENFYQWSLKLGVARELARLPIPVGRYSKMRASGNLRNWLAFLTLRDHPAAQWEIRQYAKVVHTALAERFPRTIALFDEEVKRSEKFSVLRAELRELLGNDEMFSEWIERGKALLLERQTDGAPVL